MMIIIIIFQIGINGEGSSPAKQALAATAINIVDFNNRLPFFITAP
jgi:hypothetical protein